MKDRHSQAVKPPKQKPVVEQQRINQLSGRNNNNTKNHNRNVNSVSNINQRYRGTTHLSNIEQRIAGLEISPRSQVEEMGLEKRLANLSVTDSTNNLITLEANTEEIKVVKANREDYVTNFKDKEVEVVIAKEKLPEQKEENDLNESKLSKHEGDTELTKTTENEKFECKGGYRFSKSMDQKKLKDQDSVILPKSTDKGKVVSSESRDSTLAEGVEKSSVEVEGELSSRSPDKLRNKKEEQRYAPYRDEISRSHHSGGSIYVAEQLSVPDAAVTGDSGSREVHSFNIIRDEFESNSCSPLQEILEPVSPACSTLSNLSDIDVLSTIEDPDFCKQLMNTLMADSSTRNIVIAPPASKFSTVAQPAPLDGCRSSKLSTYYLNVTSSSSLNVDCYNIQPSPVPSPEYGNYHHSPVPSPEYVNFQPSPVPSENYSSHLSSPASYQNILHSPTRSDSSPIGSPQVVPTCTWRKQNSLTSNSSSSPSGHSFLSSPSLNSPGGGEEIYLQDLDTFGDLNLPPSPLYIDFEEPQPTGGPILNNGYSEQREIVNPTQYHTSNADSSQLPLYVPQRQPLQTSFPQNYPCLPNVSDPVTTAGKPLPQLQPPKSVVQPATRPIIIPITVIPAVVCVQEPPPPAPQKSLRFILPGPPVPPAVAGSARERLKRQLSDLRQQRRAMIQVASLSDNEVSCADSNGDTKLMILVCSKTNADILYLAYAFVERLRKIKGALEATNNQGFSALYCASLMQPDQPLLARYIAETLLENGVNIAEEMYEDGNSLAHCVSCKGDTHSKVLAELLSLRDASGKLVFNLNRPNDHSGNS